MSGFQFNNTADVDLNLIVEVDDPETQIKILRKMLPNGNYLNSTSHPINFWVGTMDDPAATETERFENIYDLQTDKWLKKSDKNNTKVPYSYVMELGKFFMDGYDLSISETERDVMEAEVYMSYDTKKIDLSEKEKRDYLSGKLNELRADIDRLKIGKHILRSFSVEGFEGMPFKVSIQYENEDPRYSMNSMVYKAIERLGYHKKISDEINKANGMIKSIEEYLSTEMIQEGSMTQEEINKVLEKRKKSLQSDHFATPITSEELNFLIKDTNLEFPKEYINFLRKHKGCQKFIPGKGTINIYGFPYVKHNGVFILDRKATDWKPYAMYLGQAGVKKVSNPNDLIIGSFESLSGDREYITVKSPYFRMVK
jgi:hypothetical protein